MLAAFLALPDKPPILSDDPEVSARPQSVQELNEMFNQQDVRRYQKARWWRVINRAMSVVGTFVIAAIVCLFFIIYSSRNYLLTCPCRSHSQL